jgi:DnaK suppressor protein
MLHAVQHAASTEGHVNTDEYRRRLLEQEQQLLAWMGRAVTEATTEGDGSPEVGDLSIADELKDEELTEAEAAWMQLRQVREALQRIDEGTFGKCVVDGEPIEEKRLQVMPWTPYCLKHQQQVEAAKGVKSPTL